MSTKMAPCHQVQSAANKVNVAFIDDGITTRVSTALPAGFPINEPSVVDLVSMSPRHLMLYFTTVIAREWSKSARPMYPARNETVAALTLSDKELVVCHTKFRCEDVPAEVVAKVRALEEESKGKVGGCWDMFMYLLKNEIRMVTFTDDVNSPQVEKYKGAKGALAMLAELAVFHVQRSVDYVINLQDLIDKVSFKVVLICGLSRVYTYAFSVHPNATFAFVTAELNRRFPRLCDPRCEKRIGRWLDHVEDFKLTGMAEHPKTALVERLIQQHKDAPPELLEEWMFYNYETNRGDRIRGEKEFGKLMKWAAECVDRKPGGCLIRVMEGKMRQIYAILKMLDEDQNRDIRSKTRARLDDITTPPNSQLSGYSRDKEKPSEGGDGTAKAAGENTPPLDEFQIMGLEDGTFDTPTKEKSIPVLGAAQERVFPRFQRTFRQ